MENQHRAIKGYRELTEGEINAMNEVKELGQNLGDLIEKLEMTSVSVDKRWVAIGKTQLQQGLMALTRAIAKPTFFSFLLLAVLVGCSSGLKEVAFLDNAGNYVVDRSLVNDRMTSTQPHASGVFLCKRKITSEQMAVLRQDGEEHSYYAECEPAAQYVLTGDQPIMTLYKGPIEAAIIGGSIGAGLALSGDTITSSGGSTSTSVGVQTNVRQKAVTGKGRR